MNSTEKIPIKRAEIAIKRFNETAIPHHLGLLKNHKSNIHKCLALEDWEKIKKEQINATRIVKQLKNILLEMDILRCKIIDGDVERFDELTLDSRNKAYEAIKEYLELQLKTSPSINTNDYNHRSNYDPDHDTCESTSIPNLQTDFQLSEHQLRSREACLAEFENLHREVEDLHAIFHKLNGTVQMQADEIEVIVGNVEETQVHVVQGERNLRKALSYKKAMYPLCGALLGTCIGGPIGLIAGLKAGGLAAVGCGILGFTGGSVIKNVETSEECMQQDCKPSEPLNR